MKLENKKGSLNHTDNLFLDEIKQIVRSARQKAYSAINFAQVEANWLVGKRIVEEEQAGKERAEYGKYIIGRMGIPYREREVNIISVAIDAPQDVINALSGKIGRLDGIGAKTVYSNIKGKNEK